MPIEDLTDSQPEIDNFFDHMVTVKFLVRRRRKEVNKITFKLVKRLSLFKIRNELEKKVKT